VSLQTAGLGVAGLRWKGSAGFRNKLGWQDSIQDNKITLIQDNKITLIQDNKITLIQDNKITLIQDNKITLIQDNLIL
jgi:hypothetical protein